MPRTQTSPAAAVTGMTIGRQVLLGYLAVILLALGLGVVAMVALGSVTNAKNLVIQRDVALVVDAYRLSAAVADRSSALRAFFLTRDDDDLADAAALDAEYGTVFRRLESAVHTERGAELLAEVSVRKAAWDEALQEVVTIAAGADPDPAAIAQVADERVFPQREALDAAVDAFVDQEEQLITSSVDASDQTANSARLLVILLGAAALVLGMLLGAAVTRRVSRRLAALARDIDGSGSEILAGMTQQVTGFTEQAAAVQETVATVDELVQTAEQSAGRARSVAERAQRSAEVAEEGKEAVDAAAGGMRAIRDQVDAIAQNVVALAERAQAISEIIAAVDDIAEQTHLLALNAAIEAARAGEHGRGFAVVAAEVKNLAEQSRRATGQVRDILGEIQRGTNTAVMVTEAGTKSVTDGMALVVRAGETITELAEVIESATLAAEQIAASSGQQAAATSQISQAMRDVSAVIDQNQQASRQTQQAAEDLSGVSEQMKALVGVR